MIHLRTRHFSATAVAAAVLLFVVAVAATASAQFARKPATILQQHAPDTRQNLRQFEKLPDVQLRKRKAAAPTPAAASSSEQADEQRSHSRSKRMIWITDDGRLALPPGTVLSISPTISLPLVRYPPTGFLSNMTMSFPLTSESNLC